jgi:hypothetical protein
MRVAYLEHNRTGTEGTQFNLNRHQQNCAVHSESAGYLKRFDTSILRLENKTPCTHRQVNITMIQ